MAGDKSKDVELALQKRLQMASAKVTELTARRQDLIATRDQANQELATVTDENRATAALARERVSENKLAIVEGELREAQRDESDLKRAIMQEQIGALEEKLGQAKASIYSLLTEAFALSKSYDELSMNRSHLLVQANDPRAESPDRLGKMMCDRIGVALGEMGWQPSVGYLGVREWVAPK